MFEGFTVLDIGAGNSSFVMNFALRNPHLWFKRGRMKLLAGDQAFRFTKPSLSPLRLFAPWSFICFSITTFPAKYENFGSKIKDESLDIVTLNAYNPFLGSPDRDKLRHELVRTVKPGGLFIEASPASNLLGDKNFLNPYFSCIIPILHFRYSRFWGYTATIKTQKLILNYPASRTIVSRFIMLELGRNPSWYVYTTDDPPPGIRVWKKVMG